MTKNLNTAPAAVPIRPGKLEPLNPWANPAAMQAAHFNNYHRDQTTFSSGPLVIDLTSNTFDSTTWTFDSTQFNW